MERARELILAIAKALVDAPEQVSVDMIDRPTVVVFELAVPKSEVGKIIGKQGAIAAAIRTLLGVRGGVARRRLELEIRDQQWPRAPGGTKMPAAEGGAKGGSAERRWTLSG